MQESVSVGDAISPCSRQWIYASNQPLLHSLLEFALVPIHLVPAIVLGIAAMASISKLRDSHHIAIQYNAKIIIFDLGLTTCCFRDGFSAMRIPCVGARHTLLSHVGHAFRGSGKACCNCCKAHEALACQVR